jgi:RND family efflux transporter MFP subunit
MNLRQRILPISMMGAMLCMLPLAAADDANSPAGSDNSATPAVVQAFSKPSETHNLSFPDIGIVKELLVKPGDSVKAGQVLMDEDSDVEELEYQTEKLEAESTGEIDEAVADRDSKKLIYENLEKALAGEGANASEVEEAKLAYEEAEIKIRLATEKHEQFMAELKKEETKIAKMKLLSPVDGIVEKINLQAGEVVDPNKPEGAVTVVNNTPLWVDLHLPPAQAAKLKLGDKLQIAYVQDPDQWITGTVIYFDPVVDASVDQQTVRLELANDENKPSGLLMNIRVSPEGDSH